MNYRPSSATKGNRRLRNRRGVRRWFHVIPEIEILPRIILLLLVSCVSGDSQNTASLTLLGVMPAVQRLNISPIQTIIETNRIIVTLDVNNNATAGYAVAIQSKAATAGTNGGQAAYQLKYGGRSLALTPGTSRVLSGCTGDKSANTILQISNPSALSNATLTLTVITQ
jgi:hypothetical protein